MADAIVDGALLVETGRIAMLARQGLEDPTSLTPVQARQVFGAFLLLFAPLVALRGEAAGLVPPGRARGVVGTGTSAPGPMSPIAHSEFRLVAVRAGGRVLCRGTLTLVGLFVDVP